MSKWGKRLIAMAVAVVVVVAAVLVGSAVHLLPQLRNPFAEHTEEHSGPVLLQSIVELSRYEAASGSFQVVVDITTGSVLPSFLVGSDTLFIGVGTDNAFVDFSHLKGDAVKVSDDRLSATITLGHAQLEPATLDVHESHVYAQQQGLFTRINEFLSGNPNSQQALYELAQKQIQAAAEKSPLVADAEKNTRTMLVGLLQSLGFKNITVNYADNAVG
ncbi:DUF4230 domain-containing protein [Amycolatopsis sp. WQ 127309]|uniref:DUF4230 domain-containing protein n=1 Tax=Amycolatopsis sp. WQ 127309 TaxID=2932773 RepID=UPI001FF5679E|nr:DUF4230 domain-containing protein [Amycolatopsis sp. WQ 127309]UOZ05363.1 DUF4230 domain-containing protein [Amycolatopsis sp. WQ 127309]